MSYVGMIYVDYTHSHPVMRAFCSILLERLKAKRKFRTSQELEEESHLNSEVLSGSTHIAGMRV
jgi:hypothetical protein